MLGTIIIASICSSIVAIFVYRLLPDIPIMDFKPREFRQYIDTADINTAKFSRDGDSWQYEIQLPRKIIVSGEIDKFNQPTFKSFNDMAGNTVELSTEIRAEIFLQLYNIIHK